MVSPGMPKHEDGRRYYKSVFHYWFWQIVGTLGMLAWEPIHIFRKWWRR